MPPLAPLPQIPLAIPAGTNPQDAQQAQDAMAVEYTPQVNTINQTIQTIQSYLDRDVGAQQQYGQIADQKISQIGSELAQTLQGNVQKTGDIYSQGSQKVGAAYDEAGATLKGVNESLMSGLTKSAANLGQSSALAGSQFSMNPLERLSAESGILQQRNATGKAAATSNLETLGTQMKAIAQKAVGDSEQGYAQKRSNVVADVLRTIGNLQMTSNESTTKLLQQYANLAETAGPKFRLMLSEAASARTKAEIEVANRSFDNALKLANLEVAQGKANQQNDPNSLDNIIKGQTIAKNDQALQGGLMYKSPAEGNAAMQSMLDQARRPDRGSDGLSGTQVAGIQNFINNNLGQASMSGIYNTTNPIDILASIAQQNIDPKTHLVNLPMTLGTKYKQEGYQVDMQTLLEMLTARFGNVGTAAKIGTKIK